jgi:hypothetical protein
LVLLPVCACCGQARGSIPGTAAAVSEGELEQLMKALSLYNLEVHKVRCSRRGMCVAF